MTAPSNWRVVATARGFDGTPEAAALLRDAGCELVTTPYSGARFDYELGGDALVALLDGADAYIAGSALVSRDVLERAPRLKLVSRRGVGYERIDLDAARDRGVLVTIANGVNQHAVADHVFALLLAVARRIPDANRSVHAGRWESFIGPELRGKTLGIVGLGRVGKGVARRGRGFDMRVVATDPVRDDAFARANGVAYVSLDELLNAADVVSVNASLNDTSRGLLGPAAFARMKPSAILVNTARGGIVDEAALAAALRGGTLLGAGVDVFEREPPAGSPLIGLPNAVLTPHTAAYTHEAMTATNLLAAKIRAPPPLTERAEPADEGKAGLLRYDVRFFACPIRSRSAASAPPRRASSSGSFGPTCSWPAVSPSSRTTAGRSRRRSH